MKIVYGKNLSASEFELVGRIANECGIMFDTARLLLYRGIDTVEKAKRFLNPGKHGFNDPFKLNGMTDAVVRIQKAKDQNQRVLVFGDYDADGVCATTVLYYCLKEFGITPMIVVPERESGYGLNLDIVNEMSKNGKIDLLITVDCGISDREKIEELKGCGTDVIVTDHHEPPELLPECICINPKIKGQAYPFDGLCGAGVAYKLGYALIGNGADKYLDFVSLATVADSMDLTDENRDIVVEGLKLIQNPSTQRLAFKCLLSDSNRQITGQTLAYVIAPRINAGGRMGDAMCALEIFTTEDENKIFDLAVKLNQYNIARQVECDNIYREAKEKIKNAKSERDGVIMVSDEKWQPGFIGIVAAKLVEDFSRPVIVFAGHDGYLKGSARSIDGVNIYDAISSTKDLLIAFGGHSQAAGIAVEKENYQILNKALNDYVYATESKIETEKKIYAEWDVSKPLSIRFAREIDMLEPFGVGNRKPVFTTTVSSVESLPLKAGSPHYSYKTDAIEILDFNGEKNVFPLLLPLNKKVAFEVNLSKYKNRESLKGYSRQVICESVYSESLLPYVLENELDKISDENIDYVVISVDQAIEKIKNGATAVVSDPNTLYKVPKFSEYKLNIFGYTDGSIILSPTNAIKCNNEVVYLDYPISINVESDKVFVIDGANTANYLKLLSTDRNEFAKIYSKLISLRGKQYLSAARFASSHFEGADVYQVIFALKVFMELGIFYCKNGVFEHDENIKSVLTNSKVYSKIYGIKG